MKKFTVLTKIYDRDKGFTGYEYYCQTNNYNDFKCDYVNAETGVIIKYFIIDNYDGTSYRSFTKRIDQRHYVEIYNTSLIAKNERVNTEVD